MIIEKMLSRTGLLLVVASLFISLSGCTGLAKWGATSGPSKKQIQEPEESKEPPRIKGIELVDVNDSLARKLTESKKLGLFSDIFPTTASNNYLIGPGDVIEASVWETPPAVLFGTTNLDPGAGSSTTQMVTFPEQMVTPDGTISIPFAGRITVNERTTQEIEEDIVKHLTGKANQPQALVRVIQNNTSKVTVVGEVNNSTMMPLTPKGERLLDAIAAGGGVKQPLNKVAIQYSREDVTATMALDSIIRDPRQNIMLKPGDVVTALFQPQSFSVLGATGKNDEVTFEAQGISLAQALSRAGGLLDNRADAQGVFIFRFEDADLVERKNTAPEDIVDGKVPVIYQVNLRDPASFFVTQNFPMQNHDIIYVSNAPGAEFEKFVRLLSAAVSPLYLYRFFQ